VTVDRSFTVKNFHDKLQKDHGMVDPSFASESKIIYERVMAHEYSAERLNQPLSKIIASGDIIFSTDTNKVHKKLIVHFKSE